MVTRSDAMNRNLRAGVCLAALVVISGCSNSFDNYLQSPIYTASTNNQREILLASAGTTTYAPIESYQTQHTAAAPGSADIAPGYTESPRIVVDRQELPAPQTAEAAPQRPASGFVIKAARGDSLGSLSQQYNVSVEELRAANDIGPGGLILPGQDIVIPGASQTHVAAAPAQYEPARVQQQVTPVADVTPARERPSAHTVVAGETVSGIAARYGLTSKQLASANEISNPNRIRIGQKLKVPEKDYKPTSFVKVASLDAKKVVPQPDRTTVAPAAATAATGSQQLQPLRPISKPVASAARPEAVVPAKTKPVTAVPLRDTQAVADLPRKSRDAAENIAAEPARAVAAIENEGLNFRWPARGRVVSTFGDQIGDIRNDGINVLVPEGASVKAAEGGTVLYAGDRLKGYGRLVLIRHTEGYVTAYAHNSELLVAPGDIVKRGQIIAKAGRTGGVDSPQVHFEIRKGAQPVNPLDYLSASL